jgi:hypothetical protein
LKTGKLLKIKERDVWRYVPHVGCGSLSHIPFEKKWWDDDEIPEFRND